MGKCTSRHLFRYGGFYPWFEFYFPLFHILTGKAGWLYVTRDGLFFFSFLIRSVSSTDYTIIGEPGDFTNTGCRETKLNRNSSACDQTCSQTNNNNYHQTNCIYGKHRNHTQHGMKPAFLLLVIQNNGLCNGLKTQKHYLIPEDVFGSKE